MTACVVVCLASCANKQPEKTSSKSTEAPAKTSEAATTEKSALKSTKDAAQQAPKISVLSVRTAKHQSRYESEQNKRKGIFDIFFKVKNDGVKPVRLANLKVSALDGQKNIICELQDDDHRIINDIAIMPGQEAEMPVTAKVDSGIAGVQCTRYRYCFDKESDGELRPFSNWADLEVPFQSDISLP